MAALVKLIVADMLQPEVPPNGNSLEERINTFLATVPVKDVMDVQVNLSKTGKYGENPVFSALVLYKT